MPDHTPIREQESSVPQLISIHSTTFLLFVGKVDINGAPCDQYFMQTMSLIFHLRGATQHETKKGLLLDTFGHFVQVFCIKDGVLHVLTELSTRMSKGC